jgi:hypothetical protein
MELNIQKIKIYPSHVRPTASTVITTPVRFQFCVLAV